MLNRRSLTTLLALPLCLLALQAQATILSFNADINAGNELPTNSSTGTGTGFFAYDTDTDIFTWNISFNGLTDAALAAHIHSQPRGTAPGTENGGVVINLDGPGAFMSGVGSSQGIFLGMTVLGAGMGTDLLNNLWYVNIHTQANRGGEIRGQVVGVPEPGSLAMFALGIAGLVGLRRRGKRYA